MNYRTLVLTGAFLASAAAASARDTHCLFMEEKLEVEARLESGGRVQPFDGQQLAQLGYCRFMGGDEEGAHRAFSRLGRLPGEAAEKGRRLFYILIADYYGAPAFLRNNPNDREWIEKNRERSRFLALARRSWYIHVDDRFGYAARVDLAPVEPGMRTSHP